MADFRLFDPVGDGGIFGGFGAINGIAPVSGGFATINTRNGHRVLEFNESSDEAVVFGGSGNAVMHPMYTGSNLTVRLYWLAATATSGNVVWDVQWERHEEDAFDLDADGFAAAQSATDSPASASGEVKITSIVFTQAQADGITASDSFRLLVTRNADSGSDTMSGDAQLLRITWEATP